MSKTFFRRNTDVFQGKMTRRTAKRPAVRVRWELEEYTLIKSRMKGGETMDLFSSVTELRGIGPTRAKQLQRLHIETLYDLIAFFPRAYEDRTKLSCVAGLEPATPACFEAMVISNPQLSRIRKGMELVKVRVADETGRELPLLRRPARWLRLSDAESGF